MKYVPASAQHAQAKAFDGKSKPNATKTNKKNESDFIDFLLDFLMSLR
jgi:hypothetical protein